MGNSRNNPPVAPPWPRFYCSRFTPQGKVGSEPDFGGGEEGAERGQAPVSG